ncbi:MAG: transcriptional regulator [Sphingobacteriales bacterium]|nr:MAG: transcriptional regulator [Sphingobacteriales bacterium]
MQGTRRDVFQAIADPTRREIIKLVSTNLLNLNAVADHFEISRPAISRHVRILSECGLILIEDQGRERFCRANLNKLKEVDAWLDDYRKFWHNKLEALGSFLEKQESQENRKNAASLKKDLEPPKDMQSQTENGSSNAPSRRPYNETINMT